MRFCVQNLSAARAEVSNLFRIDIGVVAVKFLCSFQRHDSGRSAAAGTGLELDSVLLNALELVFLEVGGMPVRFDGDSMHGTVSDARGTETAGILPYRDGPALALVLLNIDGSSHT